MSSLARRLEERAAPQIPAPIPRFEREVALWAPQAAAPRAGEGRLPDGGPAPPCPRPGGAAGKGCQERSGEQKWAGGRRPWKTTAGPRRAALPQLRGHCFLPRAGWRAPPGRCCCGRQRPWEDFSVAEISRFPLSPEGSLSPRLRWRSEDFLCSGPVPPLFLLR